jgi:hypothetical protein
MWNFNDKGLKEAVIKAVGAFKPKDTKDVAHFDANKASIIAGIQAIATNGVVVAANGGTDPTRGGNRFTISTEPLKLTV